MMDADLVAAVSARVAYCEMARRIPDWDGRSVELPAVLGPLTALAGRVYPTAVLERRRRFLRAVGWCPDPADRPAENLVGGAALPVDGLPPEASVADHLAVLLAAGPVEQVEGVDPDLVSLLRALGDRAGRTAPEQETIDALNGFFDRLADDMDPSWRERWASSPGAATAWARVEATGLPGDRFFGRYRPVPRWAASSRVVWWLAEHKRRRWG